MENAGQKILKKRFRIGWRFFLLLFLGMSTGFVLLALWWYYSTADIETERQRAGELGLAITYADLFDNNSDADLEYALDEVFKIVDDRFQPLGFVEHPDFADIDEDKLIGYTQIESIYPGRELDPVSLRYFRLPEIAMAYVEIRDLIKDQAGKRLTIMLDDRLSEGYFEKSRITGTESLVRMLCDYAFSGDHFQYLEALDVALKFQSFIVRDEQISLLVNAAVLGLILDAMEARFDDVPLEMLVKVDEAYDRILEDMNKVNQCFFLDTMHHLKKGVRDAELAGIFEIDEHDGWEMLFAKIKLRYGRAYLINLLIELANVQVNSRDDLKKYKVIIDDYNDSHNGKWYGQAATFYNSPLSGIFNSIAKLGARIDLLIAIRQGMSDLPRDAFGNPYKEVRKGTKLLGYYSIGENGVDDGWENEDGEPIWLFGYLEKP